MESLNKFLQGQKILQISPYAGEPWIANVFMGCKSAHKIYFIGSPKTLYGKQLTSNGRLAFATAWTEDTNHKNRKGIQGVGYATLTDSDSEIATGVSLHNHNYPEFADRITVDWVRTNENGSGVWVIEPEFIKFWNDEQYGLDGTQEFTFPR